MVGDFLELNKTITDKVFDGLDVSQIVDLKGSKNTNNCIKILDIVSKISPLN
jgi:hypothetical protein